MGKEVKNTIHSIINHVTLYGWEWFVEMWIPKRIGSINAGYGSRHSRIDRLLSLGHRWRGDVL